MGTSEGMSTGSELICRSLEGQMFVCLPHMNANIF